MKISDTMGAVEMTITPKDVILGVVEVETTGAERTHNVTMTHDEWRKLSMKITNMVNLVSEDLNK